MEPEHILKMKLNGEITYYKTIPEAITFLQSLLPTEGSPFIEILNHFNKEGNCSLKATPAKRKQVATRLLQFSKEEIMKAITYRAADDWQNGGSGDGKIWKKNWATLFRSDDKIEEWLNREPADKQRRRSGGNGRVDSSPSTLSTLMDMVGES